MKKGDFIRVTSDGSWSCWGCVMKNQMIMKNLPAILQNKVNNHAQQEKKWTDTQIAHEQLRTQ